MIPDALLTSNALVEDEPRGPAAARFARLRPPAHAVPLVFFALAAAACFTTAASGNASALGRVLLRTARGGEAPAASSKVHMLRRRELLKDASEPMSIPTPFLGWAEKGSVSYLHLWVSEDGVTHLADCTMKAIDFNDGLGRSTKTMRIISDNSTSTNSSDAAPPPHHLVAWRHAERPQFVAMLAGTWLVNTTDGDRRSLAPGTWLYQDDTARHPAAQPGTNKAMHSFKALGPGSQLSVEWEREPVVGQRCPF